MKVLALLLPLLFLSYGIHEGGPDLAVYGQVPSVL